MANRLGLQQELEELLGSRQVYFQPPESIRMQYPAIVYDLDIITSNYANDGTYQMYDRYSIMLITRNPDDETIHKLGHLPKTRFERQFIADNLHHYVYKCYHD